MRRVLQVPLLLQVCGCLAVDDDDGGADGGVAGGSVVVVAAVALQRRALQLHARAAAQPLWQQNGAQWT